MKLASIFEDGWELEDGELRHRQSPKTFYIPPGYQRYLLGKGELVKLMFRIGLRDSEGQETEEVERMWVIVDRRVGLRQYVGTLDNDAYCTKAMTAGLKVVFEPRHVIQICEKQETSSP
jgi:hypothetical protein